MGALAKLSPKEGAIDDPGKTLSLFSETVAGPDEILASFAKARRRGKSEGEQSEP